MNNLGGGAGNSRHASMEIGAETQHGYQCLTSDEGRFQYTYKGEAQERRRKWYSCSSCKRTFESPQGLNGHQNHHKRERILKGMYGANLTSHQKGTYMFNQDPKHVHENPKWVLALEALTLKKRSNTIDSSVAASEGTSEEQKEVESTDLDLTLKL